MGILKKIKMMYQKIRFVLIIDGIKRANFLKRNNILKEMGENCLFQSRNFPMDPEMIKIHDNVTVAANVTFVTHDAIRHTLVKRFGESFIPHIGCIEVMDNVFIGIGSIILPNVKIGENSIIAAGCLVNKDVPANSIVGGVPARIIGDTDMLIKERREETQTYKNYSYDEYVEVLWKNFENRRENKCHRH